MKKPKQKIPVEVAEIICADLPDGAYWAMMEELTGLEPAELVETFERPKKKRRK